MERVREFMRDCPLRPRRLRPWIRAGIKSPKSWFTYSTAVQPGERVMIAMGGIETYPSDASGLRSAASQAGAYPQVQFLSEALRHSLLKYGDADQHSLAARSSKRLRHGLGGCLLRLAWRGVRSVSCDDIPASALSANQAAQGADLGASLAEDTLVPRTRAQRSARFAIGRDTDLATLEDMFFAACLLDYETAAPFAGMSKRRNWLTVARDKCPHHRWRRNRSRILRRRAGVAGL